MTRSIRVVVLAAVLLSCIASPGIAASADGDVSVTALEYAGEGSVPVEGDELTVWLDGSHAFDVTLDATAEFDGFVCLDARPPDVDGEGRRLGCTDVSVGANETVTVTVGVDDWPANRTGPQEVVATVTATAEGESRASDRTDLAVLRADGDADDDDLSNQREVETGTDIWTPDTDGDGLSDGEEVRTYETSPLTNDTDGDGLTDGAEVDTHGTSPTTADSDDDGLTDPAELDRGTDPTVADTDGDGLSDGAEVNVHETDPTAPDTDGDGLDDGAEVETHETNPLEVDTDDDGLADNLEVRTYDTDPRDVDSDDDSLQDGPEVHEYGTDPAAADTDGDGLDDGQEVNTYETDPTKADTDGDGLSDGAEVNRHGTDPTDPDSDGDGRPDRAEVDTQATLDPSLALLGLVGVVVAGGLGGLIVRRRGGLGPWSPLRRLRDGGSNAAESDDGTSDGGATATSSGPSTDASGSTAGTDAAVESAAERPSDAAAGPADSAIDVGTGDGDGTALQEEAADLLDVPREFLSKEERVLVLLAENDGRLRQTAIVSETGWSKSKVSRVLSAMAEDGRIVKVDVGRGNLVAHPDAVPDGAEPPSK